MLVRLHLQCARTQPECAYGCHFRSCVERSTMFAGNVNIKSSLISANNVCFSEDRSNPAYRYPASPLVQNRKHPPPAGCLERSQGCFCFCSEALIRFFGFDLVTCPSRFSCFPPACFFFSFSCTFLLDLVCARRSYIHRLLLLAAPCWSLGVLRWCCCPLLVFLLLLFDLLNDFPDLPLRSL